MNEASKISDKDIESLNESQFTKLINSLLIIETSNSTSVIELSISAKENTADGGEDGRLHLRNDFNLNQFIKHHKNFLQIKAYDISPSDCAKEIQTKENNIKCIKPIVKKAIEGGYTYVWCIKYSLTASMKDERITKTKESFNDYELPQAKVDIIDANYLRDWVNNYPSIIAYVKSCKGETLDGIQWLDQCPEYSTIYHHSTTMDDYMTAILNYVNDVDSNGAMRVIGNSGIGKTHFVINALSKELCIKIKCLYINFSDRNDISNIIDLVNNYKNSQCILILDNCPLSIHIHIQKQKTKSTTFKLISINSEIEEDNYREYHLINIVSQNQTEAVAKILEPVITGEHKDVYLKCLTEYCNGYPLLANKISLAIKQNGLIELNPAKLINTNIISKWLFEKIPDISQSDFIKVITGLSFFSYVRFIRNNTLYNNNEQELADEQFKFLTKYFFGNIAQKEFIRICSRLIDMSFLEQKGTLISVRPLPLAAYMIKEAINSDSISLNYEFKPALQELNNSPSQAIKALEDALFLQLKQVITRDLKDILNVVNAVFGDKSPFSRAENILTSRGSSLLRHLTDIDPQIAIKLINQVMASLSHDDLLQISGQMRRNIIWTLEALCYYENTFATAAKLLLRFATAENESIANNATGQFAHLFQLFLPGTEANYAARVNVINWALNHPEQQYFIPVLIKAMTIAFYYRGSFTGNPRSSRNTKHLNEYQPKTNKEILDYWISLLELLLNNFDAFPVETIYKAFNDAILQTLIENQYYDYVERFLDLFDTSNIVSPYSELINTLQRLKIYNQDIDVSKVDDLLDRLQPNDLIGRIQTQIINPSYGFGEHALLEKDKCVLEIAQELLALSEINDCYRLLINADSWVTSDLGMKIGQLDTQKAKDIFNVIKNNFELSNIKLSFISGLLWGINDQDFITDCFKNLATMNTNNFIFNLAANIRISKDIFTILLEMKNERNLSSDVFSRLNFSQVSNSERKWFIDNLLTLDSVGVQKVLELLLYKINRNEIETIEWIGYVEQILMKTNVFLICNQNIIDYTLHAVLVKLIELKEDSVEIIAEQLNDYCAKMLNNYPPTYYWNNLFPILIDKCYATIWNKYLGELFLQDWHGCFFIKHILSLNLLINSERKSKLLLEWCISNKNRNAHILIARNIVIFDENDQCIDFVIDLIKLFDDDLKLLEAININMHEFSWTGDVSNYYLKCIRQLENMKHHFINNDFILEWINTSIQNFENQHASTKQQEDERNLIESLY